MALKDPPELLPIPGYRGYYGCSDGYILSMKSGTPRKLKPHPHPRTGHLRVKLYRAGHPRGEAYQVHRLICWIFHGPPPDAANNLVLHEDDDPTNNCPGNLSWGSYSKNNRRAPQVWFEYPGPHDEILEAGTQTRRAQDLVELRARAEELGVQVVGPEEAFVYRTDDEFGF